MVRKKPGPTPERLKIDGEFEDAIRKALRQERPEGGWPDHEGESDQEKPDDASESDDPPSVQALNAP